MCLICVEMQKERMHPTEAYRALREFDDSTLEAKEHKQEVLEKIHKRLAEDLASVSD